MLKSFDLFKLHSNEDNPRSWIWVKLDSKIIKNIYLELLQEHTQKSVVINIRNKLNCGFNTVEKHLVSLKNSEKTIWIPLPIVIELVSYKRGLKNIIIASIKNLKNYNTKPIRAIKELNEILAKTIGAHIADGYLQKIGLGYKLKVVDERIDSILKFRDWIKQTFDFDGIIDFCKEENYWICWVRNKVIGRYFEKILKIPSGKKFDIAKEPEIIKNSPKKIRKAFALGIFTFDGGIKTTGTVSLTTKSKDLADDLLEILKLDNLRMNLTYNISRNLRILESDTGRNREIIKKWLKYFERDIWKYKRLDFFLHPTKYSEQEIFELFPKNRLCKISLKDVYFALKKLKVAKPKEIVKELESKKKIKLGYTTVYKHLFILNKVGLILKNEKYLSMPSYGLRQTTYKLRNTPMVR